MAKKNNSATKYITEKYLNKRFKEQTKIILEAVDFSLKKYSKETNARFDSVDARFDSVDARFDSVDARFGNVAVQISDLRDELYIVRDELKTDINNVQILIDGYVKAQEDFKQEFVIMKEEIRQMKQLFREKLGVEIRAF